MNWRAAFSNFVSSFGMPAFLEGNVPNKTAFPYATFTIGSGDFGEDYNATIHIHHYTESEAVPNAKAEEICNAIRNGMIINCEEGALVLTTGSPEWNNVTDEDRLHKHRVLNVQVTFLLSRR